jgi:hypothetical protein
VQSYPDAGAEIPSVRMTVYVDIDHVHDLVIRRLITGILIMLNNTHTRLISKRQNAVETSIYGSESVASSIDTELIFEVKYMLVSGSDIRWACIIVRR